MLTGLKFREYRPTDRDACIAVFQSNVPRYFRDHELNGFLEFVDWSGCPYFVLVTDEIIIGCGGFGVRPRSDTADLCWGMVDSSHHRKHLGEFLLFARLNRIIREAGVNAVRLGTSQLVDPFFQRFGFAVQGRTTDGIAAGLDEVEMRLELTAEVRNSIQQKWNDISGQG